MRLFVALEIPPEVRENLAALIRELRAVDSRPKWVRAENLHVTLKFIGETAPERLEGIREALLAVRSSATVTLCFRSLGFFPHERRPRVFWAGMNASANLAELARDIEGALEKSGVPPEQRAFSPHLTLARLNDARISRKLGAEIQSRLAWEFGSYQTSEFHLYESKLKPGGAEYKRLASYSFFAESGAR